MITHQHHDLFIESCSVRQLAEHIPTPFYAYSQGMIQHQAAAYQAMAATFPDAMVCYAVKANNHPAILSLLAEEGLGADVVSGYELRQALAAGIPPQKIVFSGVAKTEDEIRNFIFEKDQELRSEKNPYISKQYMDSLVEERIEILIWLFDKKNQSLSPSQVYSKKFDECFKHLKSKGY